MKDECWEEAALQTNGVITRSEGAMFWVDVGGEEITCVLRGRLKQESRRVTSLIVVGDLVDVELLPDGTGAIRERLERQTELVRPGFRKREHITAANLDQVVIVQSARQPEFNRHTVERYLVTARRGGMNAVVVVNKCDLEDEGLLLEEIQPLVEQGVYVLLASAARGGGLDELRALLGGRVSGFVGKSGVGKSSLLNALYPDFGARVSDVSDWSGKGQHTTTASRLYPIPEVGYIADTPGMRQVGLFEDSGDDIDGVFGEISALAAKCKFRDCSHVHEPKCAVKAAVENGEIDEDRYRHYLRLKRRH